MKEAISKKVHDIRGSLNVVWGFMKYLDKENLNADGLELYEACRLSLDKIEKSLDEIRSLVKSGSV